MLGEAVDNVLGETVSLSFLKVHLDLLESEVMHASLTLLQHLLETFNLETGLICEPDSLLELETGVISGHIFNVLCSAHKCSYCLGGFVVQR